MDRTTQKFIGYLVSLGLANMDSDLAEREEPNELEQKLKLAASAWEAATVVDTPRGVLLWTKERQLELVIEEHFG